MPENLVKQAFEKFHAVATLWMKYGALDSEPLYVMRNYLRQLIKGKNPSLPQSGQEWQLYSYSMDCTRAANEMTQALQELGETVKTLWFTEADQVRKYLDI